MLLFGISRPDSSLLAYIHTVLALPLIDQSDLLNPAVQPTTYTTDPYILYSSPLDPLPHKLITELLKLLKRNRLQSVKTLLESNGGSLTDVSSFLNLPQNSLAMEITCVNTAYATGSSSSVSNCFQLCCSRQNLRRKSFTEELQKKSKTIEQVVKAHPAKVYNKLVASKQRINSTKTTGGKQLACLSEKNIIKAGKRFYQIPNQQIKFNLDPEEHLRQGVTFWHPSAAFVTSNSSRGLVSKHSFMLVSCSHSSIAIDDNHLKRRNNSSRSFSATSRKSSTSIKKRSTTVAAILKPASKSSLMSHKSSTHSQISFKDIDDDIEMKKDSKEWRERLMISRRGSKHAKRIERQKRKWKKRYRGVRIVDGQVVPIR